jgi:hypothetical protein
VIKKLTLLAGLGAGYVLGTKAGQERYEQIKRLAAGLRARPEVQQASATVQHAVSDVADKAKDAVNDTVEKVTSKTVDLTGQAPMEGAAPSGSALAP